MNAKSRLVTTWQRSKKDLGRQMATSLGLSDEFGVGALNENTWWTMQKPALLAGVRLYLKRIWLSITSNPWLPQPVLTAGMSTSSVSSAPVVTYSHSTKPAIRLRARPKTRKDAK